MRVLFLRLRVTTPDAIQGVLIEWYARGWRVVSHAECSGDYTFVLERPLSAG